MKYCICLLLFALLPLWSQAQQDPLFTQFLYKNNVFFNPASAGRVEWWRGSVVYRNQWAGIEGTPQTTGLVVEGPLQAGRAGVGFNLFLDQIGFERHTGVYGSYAYRVPLGAQSYLSAGLRGGVSLYGVDFSRVQTPDAGSIDPIYQTERQLLVPRFGAGLFWHSEHYYAGLSMPVFAAVVPGDSFSFSDDRAYLSRHLYFSAGYVFDLVGEKLQLKPFVFLRYHPAAPLQADLCAQLWIADRFSIGASYRVGDSFGAMVEVPIGRRLSIAYAYDYTSSAFRQYAQGAHELVVSYGLVPDRTKVPSIHKLPMMQRF